MIEEKKNPIRSRKKKQKKVWWRRANDWFHLWVGIVSGIPVVLISLTGCILVFQKEITEWSRPWWNVENLGQENLLPPSEMRKRVAQQIPDMHIRKLWYYGDDAPVKIAPDDSELLIYANPYTGKVLAQIDHEDFFHEIDEGHRNLWMPREIGRAVVSWSTLIFGVLLLTGIVLWWPKKWKKRQMRQAFTITWRGKWKRINYDLHNVLGFYALLLGLLMAFTGLVMGFIVVRESVFSALGGTKAIDPPLTYVIEKWTSPPPTGMDKKMDVIWHKVTHEIAKHNPLEISIHFPKDTDEAIYACTDMTGGTWRVLYFDRENLNLLSSSDKPMDEEDTANWFMRANYGLHTGYIGGMFTKWLYFFASLICASLPITGFCVWLGKRK
ncbi:PepSY-associated TM helix domain-containing protein [Sphingobacterium pedocola]|uniref:PepSY domain-containing protein n=1 Tax=Sphingobacterium pedocola TaxID=2082722 RepID=A0ABR9T827_9SPHI|nr:PepSY-associated TM helix domain-containing protein [Sphingobacterium pedocola]MBE8721152.1 PepSY domain-containing protein [Sphingobacterium pedocola]